MITGNREAAAQLFAEDGAAVMIADIDGERGEQVAAELGQRRW